MGKMLLVGPLEPSHHRSPPDPERRRYGNAFDIEGRWADEQDRYSSVLACFGKAQCIAATPVQELEGWRRVGITVDSGAADSVADLVASPAAR